jgi:hypothetical protein
MQTDPSPFSHRIVTVASPHRRIAAFPSSRFATRRIRAGFEVCNMFEIDTGNQSIFHVCRTDETWLLIVIALFDSDFHCMTTCVVDLERLGTYRCLPACKRTLLRAERMQDY